MDNLTPKAISLVEQMHEAFELAGDDAEAKAALAPSLAALAKVSQLMERAYTKER